MDWLALSIGRSGSQPLEYSKWNQIPKIHFVRDDGMEGPLVIDGVEINDEFIEKLEAYVQEELEMLEKPTILH